MNRDSAEVVNGTKTHWLVLGLWGLVIFVVWGSVLKIVIELI